jgi:DNA polymerase III epsilon subunit-like protein
MIICALDCETTGFAAGKDRITELGFQLIDVSKEWKMLATFNKLCYEPTFKPLHEEVVKVTGITDELLKAEGIPFEDVLYKMCQLLTKYGVPQAFVAHNATFDRSFFLAELSVAKGVPDHIKEALQSVPWICSYRDVDHDQNVRGKCRVLSHLALEYGIAVDPATLHRASDDVELMVKILKAANVDFPTLLARNALPNVIIRAVVPSPFGAGNDGGKGKEKAKACGFGWQEAKGVDGFFLKNSWVKVVKEADIPSEKAKLGYEIAIVQKAGSPT